MLFDTCIQLLTKYANVQNTFIPILGIFLQIVLVCYGGGWWFYIAALVNLGGFQTAKVQCGV